MNNRPKTVQAWIDSDPLRAKYWDENCPSCGSMDNYGMVFSRSGLNSNIKLVSCMDCGWESKK